MSSFVDHDPYFNEVVELDRVNNPVGRVGCMSDKLKDGFALAIHQQTGSCNHEKRSLQRNTCELYHLQIMPGVAVGAGGLNHGSVTCIDVCS